MQEAHVLNIKWSIQALMECLHWPNQDWESGWDQDLEDWDPDW